MSVRFAAKIGHFAHFVQFSISIECPLPYIPKDEVP